MQSIQAAIVKELQELRENYPQVGYTYGQDNNSFDHLIVLDFSQASHFIEDANFNKFLKVIKRKLIEKFDNHWVVFFFEQVDCIKIIIETYTPTLSNNH